MIGGLKPYADIKPSGLIWLGDVPAHWRVQRAKTLFQCIDVRSNTGDEELLTVSSKRGIIPRRTASVTMFKAASYKGHKLCWPDDLVVNSLWAWACGLGVSQQHGIISTAYSVYRLKHDADVEPRFVHEFVRSVPFHWELFVRSKGIWISRLQLSDSAFLDAPFLVPPRAEQVSIVRFLQHAETRIRRYVRAKLRLISLLNEQKQVTIQQLVTQRFQEQLPFDISGRPREVRDNKDWLCATAGHLIQRGWLKIQDGNHGELHPKAEDYVDDGIPFLMANDVRSSGLNLKSCAKITEEHARRLRIGFAMPGDVLLTHKATIGQVGMVPEQLPWPFLMLTPQVTYYRCKTSEIDPLYLFAYMQTAQFQQQIAILSSNQSTRNYIGILEQKNLVIPIPRIGTQTQIVKEFQTAAKTFDAAAERARQEIELLREYSLRLTSDVVTGKLDVREAVARLPQEAPEVEPLDEIENVPQDESMAEDVGLEALDVA